MNIDTDPNDTVKSQTKNKRRIDLLHLGFVLFPIGVLFLFKYFYDQEFLVDESISVHNYLIEKFPNIN